MFICLCAYVFSVLYFSFLLFQSCNSVNKRLLTYLLYYSKVTGHWHYLVDHIVDFLLFVKLSLQLCLIFKSSLRKICVETGLHSHHDQSVIK